MYLEKKSKHPGSLKAPRKGRMQIYILGHFEKLFVCDKSRTHAFIDGLREKQWL